MSDPYTAKSLHRSAQDRSDPQLRQMWDQVFRQSIVIFSGIVAQEQVAREIWRDFDATFVAMNLVSQSLGKAIFVTTHNMFGSMGTGMVAGVKQFVDFMLPMAGALMVSALHFALITPAGARLVAALGKNKVEGLTWFKFIDLILIAPFMGFFKLGDWGNP